MSEISVFIIAAALVVALVFVFLRGKNAQEEARVQ